MSNLTPDSFKPHLGLSSIELSDGIDPAEALPDTVGMDPIDASVEARLASILEAKNFERVMLESIRPEVTDRSIMQPGRFHALRRQILEKLELPAGTNPKGDPEGRELEELAALLRKLGEDHDLGEHYRYALLKG